VDAGTQLHCALQMAVPEERKQKISAPQHSQAGGRSQSPCLLSGDLTPLSLRLLRSTDSLKGCKADEQNHLVACSSYGFQVFGVFWCHQRYMCTRDLYTFLRNYPAYVQAAGWACSERTLCHCNSLLLGTTEEWRRSSTALV
jgi:hypothetical protein